MIVELTPAEHIHLLKLIDQADRRFVEGDDTLDRVREKLMQPPPDPIETLGDPRVELRHCLSEVTAASVWFWKLLELPTTIPRTHRYASALIELNSAYQRYVAARERFER